MSETIDSGTKFLRAIKKITSEEHDAEAIEFLDQQTSDVVTAIAETRTTPRLRLVTAFYQGAFFGLKLAASRNRQAAEARATELNIDVETGLHKGIAMKEN